MIHAARRALERVGLSNKAVILLATFGATLGFIVFQTWYAGHRVTRLLDGTLAADAPAEETLRDLVLTYQDVNETYEHAVLLGERALIDHNQDAVARFRASVDELGRLPGLGDTAAALRDAFDHYNAAAHALSMAMLETEDLAGDGDALATLGTEARLARDRLDLMLTRELDVRERAVGRSMHDVTHLVSTLSTRVLWTTLPVVALWIVAFTYVRFRIVNPLVRLARATARVARGDFDAGAEHIAAADDEIGHLVGSFRAMSAGLRSTTVSKEFLGNVVDAIEEAVIVTDADHRIRRVNRGALRLLGRQEAELAGHPVDLLGPDVAAAVRRVDPVPPAGAAVAGPPCLEARDGTRIPVSLSVSSLPLDNRAVGAVVVARDLREELAADAERRQLEQRLHQAAKLESVGQLAAGIAHEINTPIQYVGDNTRFLQDAFKDLLVPLSRCRQPVPEGPDADVLRETVEDIHKSLGDANADYLLEEIPRAIEQTLEGVQRVATIVRAMKDFSHPGNDKTSMDLNRAIETTVTVARNEWKYVADVELDLEPSLGPVQGLPGEINQVILNIVVNAAHAIAGKVRDGRKGVIRIATRETASGPEITISDNGTGIPAAIRNRIFDPFFTTKEVGKGTGQGLAIAHSVICRKHGGTLEVDSVEGEGSTFRIRLPRPSLEPSAETPVA